MKPMLAAATDGMGLRYPVLISPKLDGIRCLVMGRRALSRNLKAIPNEHIQRMLGGREYEGLDGELIVGADRGPGVFNRSTSGVMSRDGEPDFTFHVFDDFSLAHQPFKYRFESVLRRTGRLECAQPVKHVAIVSEAALLKHEALYLADGYEGVMVRDPAGLYKHGRSTLKEGGLLKLKRFEDSEAIVVDWKPLLRNTNEATVGELGQTKRSKHKAGMVAQALLGVFVVRDLKTAVEFEVGSGFDADQRRLLWIHRERQAGRIMKYKFQANHTVDKPAFPVFLGWRDPVDL